ncbi:DMT family transporter [Sediminicoccus sp. KRV36]|uniref:DMT family transporter n=1 Tax=Sediminicoccus sp. KRV36 TaxID=3133721 RepID=UPI0020101D3E|nr:DMT family transporter [Sediminicoccus rosea]UPY39023.1 DMT family transporter [Sediminicoccus rosea]
MNISPRILVGLLIGVLASAIWGGHAAVARLALNGQGFHVLDLLFCRYVPASLLLAPLVWRERAAMRALGWRRIFVLFLFAGAGNLILFATALKYAPATHGSTIAPMVMPVAGALLAWWLLRERPTPGRAAALGGMLTGVLIIAWDGLGMHPGAWRGDLMLVGAGSTWAVFTILLRRWQVPAIPATAAVTLVSVPFVLPPFLLYRVEAFFALPTSLVIWMLVAQGVLLGCVSMLLFARSVEMLGATRASTLSVVVPVMGLITSALVLGETIGPVKALGASLSVGAMLVAVLFTGRRQA